VEIAHFDRGPLSDERLFVGGHWSAYWYNGLIYGTEIARGLDVLRLTPNEYLSANEIAAAELVRVETSNLQHQERLEWPAHPVVARALLDQLERDGALETTRLQALRGQLDAVENGRSGEAARALREASDEVRQQAGSRDDITSRRLRDLAVTLGSLAS
jgi:hypothetical protein